MPRCLVSSSDLDAPACDLPEAVARHLRTVLRTDVGDAVVLVDGCGRSRAARVVQASRHGVRCEACGTVESLPRRRPVITLFQCVAKGARMDWLVEKAAELGAATLVPVLSRRSVVRLPVGERVERWERIADSALEQSRGAWRMRVEPVHDWAAAVERVRAVRPTLVGALTDDARPLRESLLPSVAEPPVEAGWFVGPEGDFDAAELRSLLDAGALPVSLGAQTLRTETAALYGLCALTCLWG